MVSLSDWRVAPGDWPAAIAETDGHQMVVAGPGTGKTEFLVRRVAHILQSGLARREQIVVLCFSRRAAASLRSRVDEAAGRAGVPIDVSTFHSLALRLNEELAGDRAPVPLTTPEQVKLVASVLIEEDPDDWPVTYRGILDSAAFAGEVADFLMRCSERLLSPGALAAMAETRSDWRALPALYRRYLQRLKSAGRTDYAVLIGDAVAALGGDDGEEIASRYQYVLVDEYQDTTPAQAEMARLLATAHGNLTVAGDPYQSIYSFRGAELRNIAGFGEANPGARRIVLTESFRVPEEIMTAALRVVSSGDLPGAAGPVTPAGHAGRSEAYIFDQETAEAEWIAEQVDHAIVVEGIEPSSIAVLVRSKKELITELSRALDRRRIPHDPPQSRLVDHPAVSLLRDLVTASVAGRSLRSASANEAAAADQAMRRVLLGPTLALGLGEERALLRARRRTWEPWSRIVEERLPEHPGLAGLLQNPHWATDIPAADGFWHLWTHFDGVEAMVSDPDRAGWRRAWAAFAQSLDRQAERDPSIALAAYFELTDDEDFEAEPMLSMGLDQNRVALTTLHQAKGLEFDLVFIANASEGVFPDLRRGRRMLRPELLSPERTTDPHAQHTFQVQEEMRLAYTAMTRARQRVVWTSTSAGVDQGEKRPSRFLLAAAGRSLDELGSPEEAERDPVTILEAETMLRRWMLDPFAPKVKRFAAATLLARHAGKWWDPARFPGVATAGPDSPLLYEQFTLSPSQAEAYATCPRKYALERRLRIGGLESPYMQSGTLFHETMERAESEVIGTGKRHNTLERALEILDEVFAEQADFGTDPLNQAHKERLAKAVRHLYTNWPGKGPPLVVEHHVEKVVAGVRWQGVIDRVEEREEGVAVVDYKTSGTAPKIDDVAVSLQLAFYSSAWDGPGKVVNASFWYPRTVAKSVTTRDLDLFRIPEVLGQMEAITEAVTQEDWSPQVGNHCGKCDFRTSCPAWPEGQGAFLP